MKKLVFTFVSVLTLALATQVSAQFMPSQDTPDMTIDREIRDAVLNSLILELNNGYVFPDKAREAEKAIRRHWKSSDYASINDARAFADRLTEDLQAVTHDKHLRVKYSHEVLSGHDEEEPSQEDMDRMKETMRLRNYGFERVEHLAGNVGYLDLRNFMPPSSDVSETAVAAMNFLAGSDALIIDLRRNGGGSPETVALLSTYLFPEMDRVHLNDLYFRPDDSTTQYWTLPFVPGKRFAGKDVYVLTSNRTFSAAEEFTYNLKNLKRATIVGETTGGGAHPGGFIPIHDHFGVFVPSGRAINPISKTNWEGTGVEPDVAVTADEALTTAHLMALRKIREAQKDEENRHRLDEAIAKVSGGNGTP